MNKRREFSMFRDQELTGNGTKKLQGGDGPPVDRPRPPRGQGHPPKED